jgi:hypothetical protein
MWVCPKCLKQVSDGSKICRQCGAILEEVDDKAPIDRDLSGQSDKVSAKEEMQDPQVKSNALIDKSEDDEDHCVTGDDREQVEVLPWTCKKCGEEVPGTFDMCWKCEANMDGLDDHECVMERPDIGKTDQPEVVSDFEIPSDLPGKLRCANDALNCPDCNGSIREIRIIDKGGEAPSHHDLEYTVPDAERSFWLKQYPVTGKITAHMCQECGAVRLFGRLLD